MYKLIVARNLTNGISCNGTIPWPLDSEDLAHFKAKTIGQVVIMGRHTWVSLPVRPLSNRFNIILSSNPHQLTDMNDQCMTFKSIKDCDKFLNETYPKLERWVIGGEAIYNAYLKRELVSEVFISQFGSFEYCDKFFKWFAPELHGFYLESKQDGRFEILHYRKENAEEMKLLLAMRDIIHHGTQQTNRTGVDTRAVFGRMFEYHMIEKINTQTGESMYRLPLLTTKKMFTRGVFTELKWFLNGRVDSKELEMKGVNIWKGNTSREYLDKTNLTAYDEGETGPIYGFQWRHWGAEYIPNKKDYQAEGIDQVAKVIDTLTNDPFSRRHIISGWNVSDLDQMCLPPCFVAGTMVLTKYGYKEIQSLLDNDLVFTHLGNWKPIINRQDRVYSGQLYTITHVGSSDSISATEEHPFLVKTIQIKSFEPLTYNLSEHTSWVMAKDLNPEKHVLCLPIMQEEKPINVTITVEGELTMAQPIDYFMVGVYVGKRGSMLDLQFIPPGWSILKQFSTCAMDIACDMIPEWVQSLSRASLRDFILGYEFACRKSQSKYYDAINKSVALALQRVYAKLSIPTRIIADTDTYLILKIPTDVQGRCYVDSQYMYMPIATIVSEKTEQPVFNLEVADDNSYVVENVATHNCHMLYQFMVHETDGQKYLSLMMTQRSCDTFLGLPFNICSLGMFLFLMARTVGMKPYKIIHSIADMHIYETHVDAAESQIARTPYAFPYIQMREGTPVKPIESYEYSDIEIVDYFSHGPLSGSMVA